MKAPLKYGNHNAVKSARDLVAPRQSHIIYAERVTYILCAFVIFGLVIHLIRLLRSYRPKISLQLASIPGFSFLTAVCRMFGYRRLQVMGVWLIQSHYLIIVGAVFIGLIVWSLSIWPLYRTSYTFGTPPLTMRTAMMAAAMYPFLFAMGLKFNPISLLTGLSHAHLQIYHQAISMIAFTFGVIHTASFVYAVLRESGMIGLKELWYRSYSLYWSGTALIFVMLWICLSSLGVFRKLSYELFVVQHIICATLFLAFSFVHFGKRIHSNIWLWATLGIWLLSITVRSLMVLFSSNFFCGPRATVRVLTQAGKGLDLDQNRPIDFLRLSFVTPLRWHAGQHVYVRFPGIYPWQAHPFTCMSIPNASPHLPSRLVLLARVGNGITRQLYNMTAGQGKESDLVNGKVSEPGKVAVSSPENSSKCSTCTTMDYIPEKHIFEEAGVPFDQDTRQVTAYLDGPYSHSYGLGIYEHAVLVAGGSGITFCIPQVTELLRCSISGDPLITKTVRLVWMVRSFDIVRWIKPEIQQLYEFVHKSSISVRMDVYAYRETIPYEDENMHNFLYVHHAQRVDVASVIDAEVSKAIEAISKTMCISACAPKKLVALVGNKVSSLNAQIAMGRLASLRDVRFVPEHFSF